MWFQLNTTFSTHLGALSTLQSNYGVIYSLSNFTKTTAPDMVKKNDPLTVVLKMVEGATFTSATMTDGTTSVTGTLASSDSTVTMTITQVKGPVTVIARAASASVEEPEDPVTPTNYTFTINPTPTSATVTLSATGYSTVSGTGSKSITVANGTTVNWSVSASGYTTRTGNWTISGGNKTENITLTASSGSGNGIINYFNPDDPDINETQYMNDKGSMVNGGGTLGWSGYMACSPGETYYAYYNKNGTYTKYPSSMVTFFDASKNRISGIKDEDYLVPEGAAYFRAPFSIARRYNDFMFLKSPDVPTTFIPYNAG